MTPSLAGTETSIEIASPGNLGSGLRSRRDLVFLCWLVCASLVTPLTITAERNLQRPVDFVYVYSLGRIATEHPHSLYDLRFQHRTFETVLALPPAFGRTYGPSPYPPFAPVFFRLFSGLPFLRAFHLWQLCSVFLTTGALALLCLTFFGNNPFGRSVFLAGAISFGCLLDDNLLNGQLSSVALFAFALALFLNSRNRPFLAGLALSACVYKPTLLLLLIPFFLLRRQWKVVYGVLSGALALAALVTVIMGIGIWSAYAQMLFHYLGQYHAILDLKTYVDEPAFSRLLFPRQALLRNVFLAALVSSSALLILRAWRRGADEKLLWSLTITATLLVNAYTPSYDVTVVLCSVAASCSVLLRFSKPLFVTVALFLFLASWISGPLLNVINLHLLTVALMALFVLQYAACMRLNSGKLRDR